MKNTRWTILAALVLAATSVAHAQTQSQGGPPPGFVPPTGPSGSMAGGMAGGAPASATSGGATADSGTVSNAQTLDSTTTTTSSSGIGSDGTMSGDASITPESGQLANTGGEPVLMSLVGLSMALGAFAIRKRVSA